MDVDSSLIASELKANIQQNFEYELPIEEDDIILKFENGPRDKPTVYWITSGS
jgi:hypothetical protein